MPSSCRLFWLLQCSRIPHFWTICNLLWIFEHQFFKNKNMLVCTTKAQLPETRKFKFPRSSDQLRSYLKFVACNLIYLIYLCRQLSVNVQLYIRSDTHPQSAFSLDSIDLCRITILVKQAPISRVAPEKDRNPI